MIFRRVVLAFYLLSSISYLLSPDTNFIETINIITNYILDSEESFGIAGGDAANFLYIHAFDAGEFS
ncbi:MAG: hypothetical protein GWN86_30430 [Desulfobacterales bacterium]|nr:hypothetical protein [Desulfobacterales bacterium]